MISFKSKAYDETIDMIIGDQDNTLVKNLNLILDFIWSSFEIIIWNFENNNESEKVIQAHDNNIECLTINKNGNLVATSSELGTLIRIFDINTGIKLFEFRRGTQPSKISSLAFSYDDRYLACCSTRNGTVHLFDMDDTERNTHSKLVGLKDYLPTWVSSSWSFKQHYLGTFSKCICDFDDKGILHIASYDGNYYKVSGVNYDNISTSPLYVETKKIENWISRYPV